MVKNTENNKPYNQANWNYILKCEKHQGTQSLKRRFIYFMPCKYVYEILGVCIEGNYTEDSINY